MRGDTLLFTLVGIAGEDDLDAPDLHVSEPWGRWRPRNQHFLTDSTRPNGGKDSRSQDVSHNRDPSVAHANTDSRGNSQRCCGTSSLSDLKEVYSTEAATVWARHILPAKNTLHVPMHGSWSRNSSSN